MADKSTELERIYTIPLRRAKQGTRSKRADRAIRDVRAFLTRHMKSDAIWLDNEVNEEIWAQGKYNIKSRIRVRATRFTDGVVEVTLPDQEAEGSVREVLAERREKAAETPVLAPVEHEHEHVPGDDRKVTEVDGVGPATAEKLEAAEIENLGALAMADAAEVSEAIGTPVETVQEWIKGAQELVAAGETETTDGDAEESGDEAEQVAAEDDAEESGEASEVVAADSEE